MEREETVLEAAAAAADAIKKSPKGLFYFSENASTCFKNSFATGDKGLLL